MAKQDTWAVGWLGNVGGVAQRGLGWHGRVCQGKVVMAGGGVNARSINIVRCF